jgi:Kef-type K+ transport system membrane component KefB
VTTIFLELTVILIMAGVIATAISRFKQPAIIAYLLTGLIVGPFGYYRLQSTDALHGLAEIGITLLLFLVGLELDISQIKKLGTAMLLAGVGQIILTTGLAFALLNALGFNGSSGLLMAVGLAFSSTVVVVKLLNEKRDLPSLYGRLAVGILLLQDFAAIFLLIFLAGSNSDATGLFANLPPWQNVLFNLAKALVLFWFVHWISTFILPKILKLIGKSDELLLVFSLAWALGLAAFVSMPFIGFNLEIGGFLAGLALAQSAVHYEIGNKVKSLRDFFVIIFFIILGAGLSFTNLHGVIIPALIITVFVVAIKPLIIMLLVGLSGYKPRTGFMAALPLGQVSEFSLILAAVGLKLGYMDEGSAGVITFVAIFSIAASSYGVVHGEKLYPKLHLMLRAFDFRRGSAEKGLEKRDWKNHVIIIGAHRLGKHIVEVLTKLQLPFVVVDQNPEVVEYYAQRDVPAICGDINDSHIQELIGMKRAQLLISTIPVLSENQELLETIRNNKYRCKLIMTAQDEEEALSLYDQKIDYVLLPHFVGGQHLARILEEDHNLQGLKKLREQHLKTLK